MSVKETFSAGQTREFFGGGDFFRLLETVAEVTVEFFWQGREVAEAIGVQAGYAEYFRDRRFDRIRIYSATAQDVKWVIREGSDVRYDRGAASVTGTVALDSATIAALERPDQATGSYSSSTAMAAVTPSQVFSAASNPNGTIILSAQMESINGSVYPVSALVSKATAPTGPMDGDVYGMTLTDGNNPRGKFSIYTPQFVPPGHGLWFISMNAETQAMRNCRFRQL